MTLLLFYKGKKITKFFVSAVIDSCHGTENPEPMLVPATSSAEVPHDGISSKKPSHFLTSDLCSCILAAASETSGQKELSCLSVWETGTSSEWCDLICCGGDLPLVWTLSCHAPLLFVLEDGCCHHYSLWCLDLPGDWVWQAQHWLNKLFLRVQLLSDRFVRDSLLSQVTEWQVVFYSRMSGMQLSAFPRSWRCLQCTTGLGVPETDFKMWTLNAEEAYTSGV